MKLFLIKALRNLIFSLFTALLFSGLLFFNQLSRPNVFAAESCSYPGQCLNNKKCVVCRVGQEPFGCTPGNLALSNTDCGSAIIGGVEPPLAISGINASSSGEIGLIFFVSRILYFANIVAGILVMINFVVAGFTYITSAGNSGNMAKINEKLMWSFIGILLIVGSYTLAAIFGLIFYGDPTFIITPVITGATQL